MHDPFDENDFEIFFSALARDHRSLAGRRYREHQDPQRRCADCTADAWEAMNVLARTMRRLGYDRAQSFDWLADHPAAYGSFLSSGRRERQTHRHRIDASDPEPTVNPVAQPMAAARNSKKYRRALQDAAAEGVLEGTVADAVLLLGMVIRNVQSPSSSISVGRELPFEYLGRPLGLTEEQTERRWGQVEAACAAHRMAAKLLDKHVYRWSENASRHVAPPMTNEDGATTDRLVTVGEGASLYGRDPDTEMVDIVIGRVTQTCCDEGIVGLDLIERRLLRALEQVGRQMLSAKQLRGYVLATFRQVNMGTAIAEAEGRARAHRARGLGSPPESEIAGWIHDHLASTETEVPGDAPAWVAKEARRVLRLAS